MTRRLFLLSIICICVHICQAQILEPVKFHVTGDSTRIVFKAKIEKGWHVYSVVDSTASAEDGYGPTWATFNIRHIKGASLIGSLLAMGNEQKKYDDMFGMNVCYFEDSVTFIQNIKITDKHYDIDCYLEYGTCDDVQCLPPTTVDYKYSHTTATNKSTITDSQYKDNLLTIFFAGFIGGLLALLTPCVWPMIPMTVSFFLKRNTKKKKAMKEAIVYGLSIIVIYLSLGIAVTLIFGAAALNSLATNATANIIFALLLIIFVLSFFGLFELRLPSSWANNLDIEADKLGQEHSHKSWAYLLSIFLMALVLVIVSFSCTGPLIGVLLVSVASAGTLLAPTVGMTGFALALAFPFALFAMFPNWLNTMPKSGNWMNIVKVTLAFIELAFALKFISVADLAYGWGILPRWLFILLWLLIFVALTIYIVYQWCRDKKAKILKIIIFAFALTMSLYMSSGFLGNPLKHVSAFLPPEEETLNANHYNDYEQGLAAAKRQNKPCFIDFTGYGCVNCRKMEAAVFTDAEIKDMLSQEYIVIRLFVDDRRNGIGKKWSQLQQERYGANAQPYYIITDDNGTPLLPARGYDEDVMAFREFLKLGVLNNK
ncbi:MAG: thioredoxin family protein [Bacteroidaceae bacterium]|nr:thioredoxin family protein [Bacteroidaceae bacterium]